MNSSKSFQKSLTAGFTLIELLVVVAIIGILAAVILANIAASRNSGVEAAVKANLSNVRNQGEIFYNTNTAVPNTYTNVCTNGMVGGVLGIGAEILSAAKANRLGSYDIDPQSGGTLTTATCNDSAGAWAAEVPMTTAGIMWCADSTSASRQETVSIGTGTVCN